MRQTGWLLVMVLGTVVGCASPYEAYNFRPAVRQLPPEFPDGTPVRVMDISSETATDYEAACSRFGPHQVIGRFNAVNREGESLRPLLPELRRFAAKHGANGVVVSCGPQVVDEKRALVCGGVLVRTAPKPKQPPTGW